MSETFRRYIPLGITFVFGIILIINFYIPTNIGNIAESSLNSFGIIIGAFAVMLGTVTLYLRNIKDVKTKHGSDRLYPVWTLILLTVWIFTGLVFGERSDIYQWLYASIYLPLSSSTYASLGLFIAAGTYRVFKVKSWESSLIVISGVLLLCRNTPFLVAIWPPFLTIGKWLMDVITMSSFRGITIGIGLGSIALGIRTLTGMETSYLGKGRD